MALQRKDVKDIFPEATKEQVEELIKLHVETTDGLNADLKEANGKIKDLEKSTKEDVDLANYVKKEDYDKIKGEYDTFKNDIANKETLANKKTAYINQVLKAENINEKRYDSIIKLTDFSKLELDDEGNFKNLDALKESAKTEWADFVTKTETKGTDVATPPATNLTKEEPKNLLEAIKFEQENKN